MISPLVKRTAIVLALFGSVGVANAVTTVPILPTPVIHELGTIFADNRLSIDIVTGSESFTTKTDQFDVFKFSMDYPNVANFKVIIDTAHDYGNNEDGIVQFSWGLWGEDTPADTTLVGVGFNRVCDGTAVGVATCSNDGNNGAVITNFQLPVPTVEIPAAGETYWIGIRNYADYTTYTLSISAAPVPEPETYAMLMAGLGLVGFVARRRKQVAAT